MQKMEMDRLCHMYGQQQDLFMEKDGRDRKRQTRDEQLGNDRDKWRT